MCLVCVCEQSSDPKDEDMQFALEDLETIKVIGKGSGGVVQLVRHKWNGKFYALKVFDVACTKHFEYLSLLKCYTYKIKGLYILSSAYHDEM